VAELSLAETEVKNGALGTIAFTANVLETALATAYCELPACDTVISQLPVAKIETTPLVVTLQELLVVPAPVA